MFCKTQGQQKKTNTLFISDGYTGNNGGTKVLTPEEATYEKTGSWFNLRNEDVTLDPGEDRIFDFVLTIPQNTTPGTHVAVIYLRSAIVQGEESQESNKGTSFVINEAYSLSSAVIIRIGDETTYDFAIQDKIEEKWIKNKDYVISFYITNTGNTYSYPKAYLSMYDHEDNLVYKTEKEIDIVYPDNTCRIDFLIPPEYYIQDTYRVVLSLEFGKEDIKNISAEFGLTLDPEEINTALDELAKEEQIENNTKVLTDETLHIIIIIVFAFIIIIIFFIFLLKNKRKP